VVRGLIYRKTECLVLDNLQFFSLYTFSCKANIRTTLNCSDSCHVVLIRRSGFELFLNILMVPPI